MLTFRVMIVSLSLKGHSSLQNYWKKVGRSKYTLGRKFDKLIKYYSLYTFEHRHS